MPCVPTIPLPYTPTLMLSNLTARSFRRVASSASHSRRAITRRRRHAPRAEATELEPWRDRKRPRVHSDRCCMLPQAGSLASYPRCKIAEWWLGALGALISWVLS